MTLDIENTAISKRLRIIPDESQDNSITWSQNEIAKQFPKTKRIEPFPGACIKTWTSKGDKIFINVCHSKEICATKDISDENFHQVMMENIPSFIIPMAIGTEKMAKDKDDIERSTFNILINTTYFEKCMKKDHFWKFTIAAILQAINEKFNKDIDMSKFVTLKNKKVVGSLDTFHIEDREPRKPANNKPLIQIIDTPDDDTKNKSKSKKKINQNNDMINKCHEKLQNYVILKSNNRDLLIGFFYLPSSNITDLTVDVGKNRIIVENQKTDYIVDTFVPDSIDNSCITANYDSKLHILRLILPLKK